MYLISDPAWKFGCGRYIQKPGAILDLPEELSRVGRKALIIAGPRAWNAVSGLYGNMFEKLSYTLRLHAAPCSEEAAHECAEQMETEGLDTVIGIGGGKIMDLAKMTGEFAKYPVINVPTICATCAAFTPLSVLYTPEGRARGSWFFENEIACILADTAILAKQPSRYAYAGIADTLAKSIEIAHNIQYLSETVDLAFAKYNARYLYDRLMDIALKLPAELEKGEPSKLIDEMVYLIIPATGIVSGSARGQGQSAMAHTLYETARTLYTREAALALHGEIVGVGLRIQQRYDGADTEELDRAMRTLGIPMTLAELGIPETEQAYREIAETMKVNPLLKGQDINVERLIEAIRMIKS